VSRGVGAVLLDLVAERARAEGIVRFSAFLLAANRDMLELLKALGSVRVIDRELGTMAVEAALPAQGAGAKLRQALRASASRSARNASASSWGSGTRPASVRKPTVTLFA
jgi:GNAT superfamily N-acetyltransferase